MAAAASIRNRLIHAHFDINLDIVWTTVTDAVPVIVERISDILGEGNC